MDRSACVVARSAYWTLSTVTRTGPAETSPSSPSSEGAGLSSPAAAATTRNPAGLLPRRPGPAAAISPARFASDEQHPALALLRAVQQAEDGLELRPAPPHRGNPGQPRHRPNRSAVMRNCALAPPYAAFAEVRKAGRHFCRASYPVRSS